MRLAFIGTGNSSWSTRTCHEGGLLPSMSRIVESVKMRTDLRMLDLEDLTPSSASR